MTEKKLREKVLVEIYKHRNDLNIDFSKFCENQGIKFESEDQQARVLHFLSDHNYIETMLYEGSDGHILSITSYGVDFAESLIYSGPGPGLGLDPGESGTKLPLISFDQAPPKKYDAIEKYHDIKDSSIEPCFNIEKLAEGFVRQIDTVCNPDSNNVCMIGIFAPWGRGKSYFFKNIKEKIEDRNQKKDSNTIHYDVVEFNAWKYQDTPAIWAYLFEVFYKHAKWYKKVCFLINRHYRQIILGSLFLLIVVFFSCIFFYKNNSNSLLEIIKIIVAIIAAPTVSTIGSLVVSYFKYSKSAVTLTRRFSKGIPFKNEMGIQAEIEKELANLLKKWVPKRRISNKKVILYVDDVDRCLETKMVSIIDSLRTVLENDNIKKRLVIICSVEEERLRMAITHKYKPLIDDDKSKQKIIVTKRLETIVTEQLDKIFLTGIALPPLGLNHQIEFLEKLAKEEGSYETEEKQKEKASRGKKITTSKEKEVQEVRALTNSEIVNQISRYMQGRYMKETESILTPRRIRIIYYRIWLANNIMSILGSTKEINDTVIKAIFDLSCTVSQENKLSEEQENVLRMVVPY
ncbi:MAG: KAP family NTPase [Bacteroidia bacterium]|nr:KAP family NTPase [Bacteroidia bacterium]